MTNTDETEILLNNRGRTHGDFADHARITQELKNVVNTELFRRVDGRKQTPLTHVQLESIDMILHKIGRIIAGDASFADHWDDIAGYARLASKGGN